jgi:hypothetical protein
MEREQMIKTIRDLVGSKIVFADDYDSRIAIGEDRPVVSITKKYVYLGCECFIRRRFDDDYTEMHDVQRIPLFLTEYRFDEWTDCKVELDKLTNTDLVVLCNEVKVYFQWRIERIPELQKELDECLKFQARYNKVVKS